MPDRKKKKPLVPKLRFPEFKDAGEWEERKLGDVYRFIPTNSLSREKLTYDSGRIRNIHYGDIHTKLRALFDIEKESLPFINDGISLKESNNDGFCVLGDVIFADASEDVDDIGKAIEIVNTGGQKIVCGLHTLHARQIAPEFIVGFPGYLFQSRGIRQQIQRESQGAKVLGISASRLATIRIFIPKQPEQQKIADCLSSLDELIELEAQRCEALKAHKKGLMQQLFPLEGETKPSLRFPEFRGAGEWEVKTLEQVAIYENGKAHEKEIDDQGKYVVVNSKFISTEGEVKKYSHSANLLAKKDDILMVLSDVPNGKAIAKCFFVDKDNRYTVNQRICKLSTKNAVSKLLFYILDRNAYFLAFDDGVKQTNLKKDDVLHCPLQLPEDKAEQQKIADCLSSLDELIELQSRKVEALKQHKKGLMQQLFPQEVI